jgi:uncharacterized membrane protein YecN with MAPEG domain
MPISVSPIYAALLALIFVYLSFLTISARRSAQVALGHNDNRRLLKRMRAHGNFQEYVPIALILLVMVDMLWASNAKVHFAGVCLVVGRLIHAYSVTMEKEDLRFRVTGMLLTFTSILTSTIGVLFYYLFNHLV